MHPAWRELFRILPVVFCVTLLGGCAEYNRIATISEENSLSGIVQLTDGFDRAGEAFFSADMRWIVFRAVPAAGQPPQLYLAKLVTGPTGITGIERPICITPIGTRSGHGSFSRDGLSLIFASTADAPSDAGRHPIQMRIFRADGWEGMVAMADQTAGIDLAQHPIPIAQTDCQECSFSPDGKWICFSAGPKGNARVAVMHADGSHLVQLTDSNDDDAQPVFSPDGKSILYTASQGSASQILLADLVFDHANEITGMTGERSLTHDDAMNLNPAWYPDGQHIIYSTSRHGRDNYELYLMDIWGRKKTRITFSPGADLLPVFSPDGKYLMWTSKRSKDGTIEVFAAAFQFPRGS